MPHALSEPHVPRYGPLPLVPVAQHHGHPAGCPFCTESSGSFTLGVLLQVVLQTREGGPRIEPYLRSYLTDALPCRAPDFMC